MARRIGQILVDLGFLTDEQLEIVLEEQEQQPGTLLGRIAEEMALITDEQLIQGLAEQMGMQTVSRGATEIRVQYADPCDLRSPESEHPG